MPGSYLVLEYSDAETIAALDPEMAPLRDVFGTLAFARSGPAVRCRFWAPGAGVPEDPATGSAAVALAAALAARGEATGRVAIDQGQEIGFPSRIELSWAEDAASIGGTTVHDETRLLDRGTSENRNLNQKGHAMTESRSYPESSNATTVLVLGIVGLFFNVLSPFAWWLGNEEIKAIDAGKRAPENRSVANAGRVLGIIGTVLLAIGILIVVIVLVIALIIVVAN